MIRIEGHTPFRRVEPVVRRDRQNERENAEEEEQQREQRKEDVLELQRAMIAGEKRHPMLRTYGRPVSEKAATEESAESPESSESASKPAEARPGAYAADRRPAPNRGSRLDTYS